MSPRRGVSALLGRTVSGRQAISRTAACADAGARRMRRLVSILVGSMSRRRRAASRAVAVLSASSLALSIGVVRTTSSASIFLLTAARGEAVEMLRVPGSTADVVALDVFDFDLPRQSTVYGDSAFTLYAGEDLLREMEEIELSPMRKKNSKRPVKASLAYLQAVGRK